MSAVRATQCTWGTWSVRILSDSEFVDVLRILGVPSGPCRHLGDCYTNMCVCGNVGENTAIGGHQRQVSSFGASGI